MRAETVKLFASRKWAHIFTVQGHGAFPLDMLRYDCCFPSRPEDVEAIRDSFRPRAGVQTIHLVHHSASKDWMPTVDRWRSFGWACWTHNG